MEHIGILQTMANQIHIRQVLALMDTYERDGEVVEFSISFVKDNGEWRDINKAAKGYKKGKLQSGKSPFFYNLKEKGIVLIRDLEYNNGVGKEKGRSISIKIDGICKFNGLNVFH